MRADLLTEQDLMRQKVMAAQKEIQTKTEELKVSGFSPESPEYRKIRKELLEKSIHLDVSDKVYKSELRNQSALINEVFRKDLYEAVQKIAKQKGYRLVLSQIVYGDETLDITNEVIEHLNTNYDLGG